MWDRIKARLYAFMEGRNGPDQLYTGLFIACLVCMLLSAFLPILSILSYALLFLMIFRCFSRNLAKRQMENQRYLVWRTHAKQFFVRTWHRIKEIKTHRYRRCPHCKAVLRLPRKVGDVHVNCPKCHQGFDVKIRW